MKIGIFDSGIGGEAVARDLKVHFPEATIVSVSDRANLPYGSKTPEHIIALTDAALQPLLAAQCDVIVIACNTATTNALSTLRQRYPRQQFIGIEPMIKTAASLTKHNIITVCATPATLASPRYKQLKELYAARLTVREPDCSSWASMIEADTVQAETIRAAVEPTLAEGVDVVVLGCTHYHWIQQLIETIVDNRARVIQPTDSIASRISQLVG